MILMDGDKKMTTAHHGQHADAALRAQRAWTARIMGGTWKQAADVAGFTDTGNCVRAVRNYFGTLPQAEREDLRDLWRERLEYLWRQSSQDVRQQKPGAIRAGVALAQRASALDGLDEPTKVSVYSPTDEQISQYLADVVAAKNVEHEAAEADIIDVEPVEEGEEPDGG